MSANVIEMIHQNPDVGSSITSFIEGEKKLLEDTKKQKDVLESDANTIHGGLKIQSVGTSLYTGPNCGNIQLNGRYFEHFPNCFYADV